MSHFQLLQHKDFERSLRDLPPSTQRKTVWAQVLLGTRGRTPNVKGTMGRNARWRRTPVQGNHYYMWWIPQSESPFSAESADNGAADGNGNRGPIDAPDPVNTILIHSVRHHDETDDPIRFGALSEYHSLPVDTLDPRYDEQREISDYLDQGNLSLATIKGLPGSGKTVALLYLLKDLLAQPGNGQVLYVTYTARLKRAAQDFIESQYVGERLTNVLGRVRIATLNEVMRDITGIFTFAEPFAELDEFFAFLDRQNPSDLGPWRNYPRTLFTEIRAYLLGQNFPEGYDWAETNRGGGAVDLHQYALDRGLDFEAANLAGQLAARVRHMRFFRDQTAAHGALRELLDGRAPAWLMGLDALVIDEVQDLTLLQIAFLSEMVRVRARNGVDRPLRFAVAGDESQIVQPSGFDWGMTKYVLGEQLGVWPDEFNFEYQRRSPDNLADLIDNSWYFYTSLPKALRPSARSQRLLEDSAHGMPNQGRIYLCAVPSSADAGAVIEALHQLYAAADHELPPGFGDETLPTAVRLWSALMTEVAARPGRVLVDLTESLRKEGHSNLVEGADEIIFLPREIKGLERTTVLIHGLDAIYRRAIDLCEDSGEGNIPRFEARRLFDEIRVALSRSTDNLVLLEAPDAAVLKVLEIDYIDGVAAVDWADLVETLQNEEMSELEAIEGYLREVEDLFEREKWEQAFARNRRAHALSVRLDDSALQREADNQFVSGLLLQGDTLLYRDRWQEAHERNRKAAEFAADLKDPVLHGRIVTQHERIVAEATAQVAGLIESSAIARGQRQYQRAHQDARQAHELAAMVEDAPLQQQTTDALADTCWQWAIELVDSSDSEATSLRVAALLDESAQLLESQGDRGGADALRVLARRYATLPQRNHLSDEQLLALLALSNQFMELVSPLQSDKGLYAHIERWLSEVFDDLDERFTLYFAWSSTAGRLARQLHDTTFQPRVFELEQRLEQIFDRAGRLGSLWDNDQDLARFRALAAGVHGRHAEASATWERMGDIPRAAEQAREAGDMLRAYQLLRTAKEPIPEELATTVKFLRLLDQIEHKAYRYSDNERAMLQARLDHLRQAIDGGQSGPA